MANCVRCGTSVPELKRFRNEGLCGGCYDLATKATDPDGLAQRVEIVEHQLAVVKGQYSGALLLVSQLEEREKRHLKEIIDLKTAYLGSLAERRILEKEIEKCRSTATDATVVATS